MIELAKECFQTRKILAIFLTLQMFLVISSASLTVHESPQGEELSGYIGNNETTFYVKYNTGEASGSIGYMNVSTQSDSDLNLTLKDNGESPDNGTDGNYWGAFGIVSESETPGENEIKVQEGEDANLSVYFNSSDSVNASVNLTTDYTPPSVENLSVPDYFSASDSSVDLTQFFDVQEASETVYFYEENSSGEWKEVENSQSFDPTELGSGATVKFRANASDQADNYRTNETSIMAVDTEPPYLVKAFKALDDDIYPNRREIYFEVDDEVSGVKAGTVSKDNLVLDHGSIDEVIGNARDRKKYIGSIILKDTVDQKRVEVSVSGEIKDRAGNKLTSGTVIACCMGKKPIIENASIDTEGPVTVGDEVSVSAVVTDNVEVDNVSVEAEEFGREKVWMYDEDEDNNYTADFTVASKSELSDDGSNKLEIVANDTNSNENSTKTDSISLDATAPSIDSSIQINRDGSNDWADEDDEIIVKLNVSDQRGISSVSGNASEFNSTLELSESEASDYSGVFEVGEPENDGEKEVKITLEDTLGNSKKVDLDSIGVDNKAPIVSIANTGDDRGYSTTRDQIRMAFDDKGSGLETSNINKSYFRIGERSIESIGVYDGFEDNQNLVRVIIELQKDLDTDATPEIELNRTLKDLAGNNMANSSFEASDGLRPYLEEGAYFDKDKDGEVDQIRVNFSENITYENPERSHWRLIDGSLDLYMQDWKVTGDQMIIQTEGSQGHTAARGPVSLEYDEYQNGNLQDLNGNNPSKTEARLEDRADPVIRFREGIDLISLPSKTGKYSLNDLLENKGNANISGIESIWRYVDGDWETYVPGRSSNDFQMMESGEGYIIKSKEKGKIAADVDQSPNQDKRPSGQTIHKDKWNLVGSYGEISVERRGTIVNDLFTLEEDSTAIKSILMRIEEGFVQAPGMIPGKAYWVSSAEDTLYSPIYRIREPVAPIPDDPVL